MGTAIASPGLPPGPAWLFVPGDRQDRWAKAADRADSVVVDLENAVGATAKDRARALVSAVADHLDLDRLVVRVNAVATPWFVEDAAMVRGLGRVTVMVPKVVNADDLALVSNQLDGAPLVALCETAASVLDARRVAAAPSCVGVMWGAEDLCVDLGALTSRGEDGRLHPHLEQTRSTIGYAARAAGVGAVDSPVLRLDRPDLVTDEARAAADLGFHAKACIHPDHVALVRDAFAPSESQLAWARDVVEAAARAGEGSEVPVFSHRGQMVDFPVVEMARLLLARS